MSDIVLILSSYTMSHNALPINWSLYFIGRNHILLYVASIVFNICIMSFSLCPKKSSNSLNLNASDFSVIIFHVDGFIIRNICVNGSFPVVANHSNRADDCIAMVVGLYASNDTAALLVRYATVLPANQTFLSIFPFSASTFIYSFINLYASPILSFDLFTALDTFFIAPCTSV